MSTGVTFDHETAMTFCGDDEDIFQLCLGIYTEDGAENLKTLPRLVAERDYDQFRVLVHAIKSTSKQIGAVAFSEKAREQEFYVKDGRTEEVDRTWRQFLEEYRQVLDAAAELAEEG